VSAVTHTKLFGANGYHDTFHSAANIFRKFLSIIENLLELGYIGLGMFVTDEGRNPWKRPRMSVEGADIR
jgi:hypothetical protein